MPILFILVPVFIVALVVYGWYAKEQRRKELTAWAAANGLRFLPEADAGLEARFPEFKCLQQGADRYAFNRLEGDWQGRSFLGFDYHYETHSTDSKGRRRTHHHYFSAVILDSPVPLQPLAIRPEHIFDKVTEFFGFDDIDFESAAFSKRFYVKAPNRRWAYDVIHQRTMEFLLAQPEFSLQFDRHHVIAHRGRTFAALDFAAAASVICGVLERLPDYVLQQQGA